MIQLFLLIGLAVIAVLVAQRFLRAARAGAARDFRRVLLWGGLALIMLLAATGRLGMLIPVIGALVAALLRLLPVLLPMLVQAIPLWRRRQHSARETHAGSDANASTVESRFLRMRLDHASGEIDGEVLAGHWAGRRLSELGREQLADLYEECARADRESSALLQAYLERLYGETWQARGEPPPPSADGRMTADEAYAVLGLGRGADRQEIVGAHRRLMQKLHPDRGGSDYLAAKINQAKEILLGR